MFKILYTVLSIIIYFICTSSVLFSYTEVISGVHTGTITGNALLPNNILVESSSSITGSIILSADNNILTFQHSGSSVATMLFGTISLKGVENILDLGNAFIQGNIEMGRSSFNFVLEDILSLKGANIYGSITMSANQNKLYFGENSHISTSLVMDGMLSNSFYLEDNTTLRTPTVSLGKDMSTNMLSLGNNSSIEGSTITMVGSKNTVIVGNNVTYSSATISISNSAEIILHTAEKDYTSLFRLDGVTENMKLTFADGFVYTGNIVLDSTLAQNAFTKTLLLEGANIVGDIILSKGWKIDFTKAMESGTLFTGTVRDESNAIIGLGISDGQTYVGDIVVNDLNGSIYIRGNSSIEGALITSHADIYIKDSSIHSLHVGENNVLFNYIENSVFLKSVTYTDNNFVADSIISNSIFGDSTGGIQSGMPLQDILTFTNTSGNLTVQNSVVWGNILIGANTSTRMLFYFQDENTIYGNIIADNNTDIAIDSLTFYGDRISAETLSIYSIDLQKRITTSTLTEKKYIEASEIFLVDNDGKSSIPFQSVNAIANDIEIYIDGIIVEKRSSHRPVFFVDVSFEDRSSDTIVLDKATFLSSRNDIFAFALTEPILKPDVHDMVIKNVITGVSSSTGIRPELFSNIIAGYEVELLERIDSITNTNVYDLVIRGISPATVSYSAVVDKGHRYTKAFWSGMREGMRNRQALTMNSGLLSVWTNTSYSFSKNIADTHTGKEDLFVSHIGIGGKQEIASGLFVSYDLAGGYGFGSTDSIAKGIPTKGDLEAKSIAFQIAFEKVLDKKHTFLFGLQIGEMY